MQSLTRYDAACRAVAEAKSFDDVRDILDKTAAIREYARRAQNRGLEIDAAEIRLRAERRYGELLVELKSNGSLSRGRPEKNVPPEEHLSRVKLDDIGTTRKFSAKCQKLAAVSEHKFEGMIGEWRERVRSENERVTTNLLKEGEREQARESYEARKQEGGTVSDLSALTEKFAVIYADPPWEFEVYSGKGKQRSAERHYDTKSLDDISALPVAALAADDCALFLWCVMPEIPGALEIIQEWGFEYKTVAFTWVKQNRGGAGLFTGMGYWTRANAELCLLATRGSPMRLAMDVHQVVMAPVREHSRKPDEVRTRIERLLAGPYLELYGRQHFPGWTVWGNEIGAAA